MKHAILLTAHNNITVVKTLMQMLDDKRFTFYLLVDKKSTLDPRDFVPSLKYSKVNILPQIVLNWGGYSTINGVLDLVEAALKDGQEHLHYLQGSDLPLKTPDAIDNFFSNNDIFIYVEKNPCFFAHYKVLCKHWFTEFKSFRTSKFLKTLNHSLAHLYKPFMKFNKSYGKLYSGSALWSIPSEFAEYVLKRRKEIEKTYKRSLAADEVFIQTIVMNSDWKNKLSVHGNARLIDWTHREGNSPKTFTINDKDEIHSAIIDPTLMFVRKIHESRDIEIAEYIRSTVMESYQNSNET